MQSNEWHPYKPSMCNRKHISTNCIHIFAGKIHLTSSNYSICELYDQLNGLIKKSPCTNISLEAIHAPWCGAHQSTSFDDGPCLHSSPLDCYINQFMFDPVRSSWIMRMKHHETWYHENDVCQEVCALKGKDWRPAWCCSGRRQGLRR